MSSPIVNNLVNGAKSYWNSLLPTRIINGAENLGGELRNLISPVAPVAPQAPDTSWHDQQVQQATQSFQPQGSMISARRKK